MPYYFFNRCPKSAIPRIVTLANGLGLKEMQCFPPIRQWSGHPFKRETEYDSELLLSYTPHLKYPFFVQTSNNTSHSQTDVRQVMNRLIDFCKPDTISAMADSIHLYDLREFK